jgi:hypothetical protein
MWMGALMAASNRVLGLVLALVSLCAGTSAWAAPAGSVQYTQGVATVQNSASQSHIAGAGAPINQGDTITTAPGSYAVLKLSDGTLMTVRPDSKLVVTTYDYQPSASGSSGSMVFGLLRGGLRAITGIIPKRDTNAARIVTPTATVGIRGTDFDARLCNGDCPVQAAQGARISRPNAIIASARILSAVGGITATDAQGGHRLMATGAPVYPGDTVETPPDGYAVLVFRDETRMTVQPNSRMKVDDFVFDKKQPSEGRFFVSLLKGGLRAFTGVIGSTNHDNVAVRTPTATVGIRGTGWDLQCIGTCAGETATAAQDGLTATVWLGEIVLKEPGGQDIIVIATGETGIIRPGHHGEKSADALQFSTPRPDELTVNMDLLFGEFELSGSETGLWVLVRDGHVSLETANGELDLGRGESGYTDGTQLLRPILTPNFLILDSTPLPNAKDGGNLLSLIQSQGVVAQCTP